MRNCPVCDTPNSTGKEKHYIEKWLVYSCHRCMHLYLDHPEASQESLSHYYLTNQTDTDLVGPDTEARIASLAKAVNILTPNGGGIDIGGRSSNLHLVTGMKTLGPGEELNDMYNTIVLSHTMEHIYDVHGMMKMIHNHLNKTGHVIIEGPYWNDYTQIGTYDVHWQHINKFRMQDYNVLLYVNGFIPISDDILPDYRGFKCYRVVGKLEKTP